MRWLIPALWLAACGDDDREPVDGDETEPPVVDTDSPVDPPVDPRPASCDAGDAAWVERAMLFLLGRRPHGAEEIARWEQIVAAHGRDVAARALLRSPMAADRWQDFLQDALAVARIGDRADISCFGEPMLAAPDPGLAAWIATADARQSWPEPFNMTDVLQSAWLADDMSAPYRLHLFARMRLPQQGANVGPRALEAQARKNFGDGFTHVWLNRDMTCLPCHNSRSAVTDRPDPAEDRHWPAPGQFEDALFGSPIGRDEASAFQVFRTIDVTTFDPAVGVAPFGLDARCGLLVPPEAVPEADYLGESGYFLRDLGQSGSVWDVEAALRAGVDTIAGSGLAVDEVGAVDGEAAFAWMVAQNFVGQVWKEAMGERLTVANYFSRNRAQLDRLVGLTDAFARSRFSARGLLEAIVADPLFNLAAPARCEAQAYGLEAVVNPWSWNEADPLRRGNGAGDVVRRWPARTLLRAAHDALGWPPPARFPADGSIEQEVSAAIGAFQRESEPGFGGTDVQGILAWASYIGACTLPGVGAGDGCTATPTVPTCDGCACEAAVCGSDPYCCEVQWDEVCVEMCAATEAGCGGAAEADADADVIAQLIQLARERDATVRELVEAVRDRLTARGPVSDAERGPLEALIGASLDAPVSTVADLDVGVRLACGATLVGGDWMLSLDAGSPGPAPALRLPDAGCEEAAGWLAAVGVSWSCGGAP
jgi:hypothetical protein